MSNTFMDRFFELACVINLDRSDPFIRNQHIIAILVKRNRILSVGFNSKDSCKLQRTYKPDPYAFYNHAEISCLDNALKRGHDPKGATIYVVRHSKGRTLGCAKPCSGCQNALETYKVRKIIHS